MRGRLVTAQAARAGVPLVIVGAAACRRRCWPLVFRRVLCVWVCAVCWLSVLGLVLVWCWLVSCCPVLLVVGGLLAGGVV